MDKKQFLEQLNSEIRNGDYDLWLSELSNEIKKDNIKNFNGLNYVADFLRCRWIELDNE